MKRETPAPEGRVVAVDLKQDATKAIAVLEAWPGRPAVIDAAMPFRHHRKGSVHTRADVLRLRQISKPTSDGDRLPPSERLHVARPARPTAQVRAHKVPAFGT